MVSPELLRRYPFFSGLTLEHIVLLAKTAEEAEVAAGHYFHHEGDDLRSLFLIVEGEVNVITRLPQKGKEVVLSTMGVGDVFGWSSLVPPHSATAGAKAVTPCQLVEFDRDELLQKFEEDCRFGYVMMQKIAQLVRERLNDLRIETMAYIAA
jgi:CRP-like cAMP-binding protein